MLSIGDRMKVNYEDRYRIKLTRRTPVIIRLDGKAFHTLTKKCEKPFDKAFCDCMDKTAFELCTDIQGAKCAYVQSDEISILLTDFDNLETEAWFDYNLQKLVSVSASLATFYFLQGWETYYHPDLRGLVSFDARAFNVPKDEVCNYFIWRQQDWKRNSVEMLARAHFSHLELHKKNQSDMHEMLHTEGVNWAKLPERYKNGHFTYQECMGWEQESAPIFTQNRQVIEKYLISREDKEVS